MYIEDEDHAIAVALCFQEVATHWKHLGALPTLIGWRRNEELSVDGKNVYDFGFEENGLVRVFELDGDVQITLEA
jgi:hypothetical protein